MKFNRKKAIESLGDISPYMEIFENQLESINTGWAIFWKGKMVKPINGKNHYYASKEAAIQAIDRNSRIGDKIYCDVFKTIYGKDISGGLYHCDHPDYMKQFRYDLRYILTYRNDKLIIREYFTEETLTKEEIEIRKECKSDEQKFDSFCANILKTVFVKKWMEEGILEIKKV